MEFILWKHFPRYWPFVRGIHRSPVNSLHKGQWRRALIFSFIRDWINGWVNNREAGDLRRHRVDYDVIVMMQHGNVNGLYRGVTWTWRRLNSPTTSLLFSTFLQDYMKKISKLCITNPLCGESTRDPWSPLPKTSNTMCVSVGWGHHV